MRWDGIEKRLLCFISSTTHLFLEPSCRSSCITPLPCLLISNIDTLLRLQLLRISCRIPHSSIFTHGLHLSLILLRLSLRTPLHFSLFISPCPLSLSSPPFITSHLSPPLPSRLFSPPLTPPLLSSSLLSTGACFEDAAQRRSRRTRRSQGTYVRTHSGKSKSFITRVTSC